MQIIESALGSTFSSEAGTDHHLRSGQVAVFVSDHDFDDGDIQGPDGTPVALRTGYPCLIDVRDTERNLQRQEDIAAGIFAAIRAAGGISAVLVDDMQHAVNFCGGNGSR